MNQPSKIFWVNTYVFVLAWLVPACLSGTLNLGEIMTTAFLVGTAVSLAQAVPWPTSITTTAKQIGIHLLLTAYFYFAVMGLFWLIDRSTPVWRLLPQVPLIFGVHFGLEYLSHLKPIAKMATSIDQAFFAPAFIFMVAAVDGAFFTWISSLLGASWAIFPYFFWGIVILILIVALEYWLTEKTCLFRYSDWLASN